MHKPKIYVASIDELLIALVLPWFISVLLIVAVLTMIVLPTMYAVWFRVRTPKEKS